MSAGKRFWEKFRLTMEPHGYVLRIPDNVHMAGGRIVSTETDADFLVQTESGTYLVECKATGEARLPFYNVKGHQEEALSDFDALGDSCHGILAVEFYDKRGYKLPHRMFLLPIEEWTRYKLSSGRKSMPLSSFEDLGVELKYGRSSYVFDGRWFR